jgi:hypothetical protein
MKLFLFLVCTPAFFLGIIIGSFLGPRSEKPKSINSEFNKMEAWEAFFNENYQSFEKLLRDHNDKELRKRLGVEGIRYIDDQTIILIDPGDWGVPEKTIYFVHYNGHMLNYELQKPDLRAFWKLKKWGWACYYDGP